MTNGMQPKLRAKQSLNQSFLTDMQDLFAGRRFAHVGCWRYSEPLFEGDPVNGLVLWNDISKRAKESGSYYIFSDEVALIHECADDLNALVLDNTAFIDLGPGGEEAIRDKVGTLLTRFGNKITTYCGVDVVMDILGKAQDIIEREYPAIKSISLEQDFFSEELRLDTSCNRLAAIIGQTMFNLQIDPRDINLPRHITRQRLEILKKNLRTGERLIVTQDCNQDAKGIALAYTEQKEVWENMLQRISRDMPVSGQYDPEGFVFEPYWIPEASALSHTYVALKPIHFQLGDEAFAISKGQRFFLHNSYKFPVPTFRFLAEQSGFKVIYSKTNTKGRMALHLLEAV